MGRLPPRQHLSSISLDLNRYGLPDGNVTTGYLMHLGELATASKDLSRVAIRMHSVEIMRPTLSATQKEEIREGSRKLIDEVNCKLGVMGKLEDVPDDAKCYKCWFCGRMDVKGTHMKVAWGLMVAFGGLIKEFWVAHDRHE